MAHSKDIRADARRAYAVEALPLEALADRYKVAVGTLSRWKREAVGTPDDWDRARAAARLTAQGKDAINDVMLAEIAPMIISILADLKKEGGTAFQKAEAIARLMDSHQKTMSIIARTSPQIDRLAVQQDTLSAMLDFVQSRFPRHAAVIHEVLLPFAEALAKNG